MDASLWPRIPLWCYQYAKNLIGMLLRPSRVYYSPQWVFTGPFALECADASQCYYIVPILTPLTVPAIQLSMCFYSFGIIWRTLTVFVDAL